MQLGMFANVRLQKDYRVFGIEAGSKVIGSDLDGGLGKRGGVGVMPGKRWPIGDQLNAIVYGIFLQASPVLRGAKLVADLQPACWPHAADDALFFGCCPVHSLSFYPAIAPCLSRRNCEFLQPCIQQLPTIQPMASTTLMSKLGWNAAEAPAR